MEFQGIGEVPEVPQADFQVNHLLNFRGLIHDLELCFWSYIYLHILGFVFLLGDFFFYGLGFHGMRFSPSRPVPFGSESFFFSNFFLLHQTASCKSKMLVIIPHGC